MNKGEIAVIKDASYKGQRVEIIREEIISLNLFQRLLNPSGCQNLHAYLLARLIFYNE